MYSGRNHNVKLKKYIYKKPRKDNEGMLPSKHPVIQRSQQQFDNMVSTPSNVFLFSCQL